MIYFTRNLTKCQYDLCVYSLSIDTFTFFCYNKEKRERIELIQQDI